VKAHQNFPNGEFDAPFLWVSALNQKRKRETVNVQIFNRFSPCCRKLVFLDIQTGIFYQMLTTGRTKLPASKKISISKFSQEGQLNRNSLSPWLFLFANIQPQNFLSVKA